MTPRVEEERKLQADDPVAIGLWLKVFETLERLEARQERLEKALKAHGVGAWQERA